MKIAVAQINPTVGDVGGNVARMLRLVEKAARARAAAARPTAWTGPPAARIGRPPAPAGLAALVWVPFAMGSFLRFARRHGGWGLRL